MSRGRAPPRGPRGRVAASRPAEGKPTPLKTLGQHFLIDEEVPDRIVGALRPEERATVVEVGPGTGALTRRLLGAVERLVAVEVDSRLCGPLRAEFGAHPAFRLVEADILELSPAELVAVAGREPGSLYFVVGNLPYNAGAAIVRHFLEAGQPPRGLIVMLQREVARTICAMPGDFGILSVAVQVYAEPEVLFDVAPQAFRPPPGVYSSVLRLDVRARPLLEPRERDHFFRVLRAGFSAPRKQLRNSLANGLRVSAAAAHDALRQSGIEPHLRPQDLTIEGWLRLARSLELRPGA